MTVTEPEWDGEQVALAHALREKPEPVIGAHGHPMSEATDPDADPNVRGRGHHYEAFNLVDHAASAIRRAQDRMQRDYPDSNLDDFVWGARKVLDHPA